jgi:peptidoglycan/xylan/chitin deacetylase (PgdA/CDA1 family)
MNKLLKSYLSKINFELGRNPKVEKRVDYHKFIPVPYKAVVLFQADLELAWAWRYSKNVKNPFQRTLDMARRERENIPEILKLCEQFHIPITWATVGHLFLDGCTKNDDLPHRELPRLPHFENDFWKYTGNDWYEYDPCSNFRDAPEWYCPDLIDQILQVGTKHEIGCHTFSHIDCRNEICPPELLESELNICNTLAKIKGIQLRSFVHPGFTIGNLNKLVKYGYTNYRSNDSNLLGYPIYHQEGIWELKNTMELAWRKQWSAHYHAYRYCTIVERAIKNNSVCVFWFHPSFDQHFLNEVLPEIFKYIYVNNDKILTTNTNDYIEFLNRTNQ